MIRNILIVLLAISVFSPVFGGRGGENRGTAGATQLVINPFGYSGGLQGLNIATAFGIEALVNNPAGIAVGEGNELLFSHTRWLSGSGISINAIGYSGHTRNEAGIGVSLVVLSLGEIIRTTIDQPDGTLGKYKPNYMHMNFAYGKMFVDGRIYVGANVKVIHESVPDASASGVAIDGGVIYRSEDRRFQVGVALRNIGPQMRYSGDGFYTRTNLGNPAVQNLVVVPSGSFDLPAQLLIGVAYNFILGAQADEGISGREHSTSSTKTYSGPMHKITPMFGFVSYSKGKDNLGIGIDYTYKNFLGLRGAFLYEDGMFDEATRTTATAGFSAGLSVTLPLSKDNDNKKRHSTMRFDYSYRSTFVFSGTHSVGIRVTF